MFRGSGNTLPFSCYDDQDIRRAVHSQTPAFSNVSDTAIGTIWAWRGAMAESCSENGKDVGNLIGTAFVARDMMQIVDALREDGLLRYWGFSYGTVLGATVAAMFPDRMDKMVLDGVVNSHEYYTGLSIEEVEAADATFDGFFTGCVANPSNCALAQDGSTTEQISQRFYDVLYKFKFFPVAVAGNIVIDYSLIKNVIIDCIYNPIMWPSLAAALHGLLTADYTQFLELIWPILAGTLGPSPFPKSGPEAIDGIRCSDASFRTNNLTALYPYINELYTKSTLTGDGPPLVAMTCTQWPFHANGRYEGNFHVKTKNPILFIGNTADPITPLVSAYNMSSGFEQSVVLQHDGYGVRLKSFPTCLINAESDFPSILH